MQIGLTEQFGDSSTNSMSEPGGLHALNLDQLLHGRYRVTGRVATDLYSVLDRLTGMTLLLRLLAFAPDETLEAGLRKLQESRPWQEPACACLARVRGIEQDGPLWFLLAEQPKGRTLREVMDERKQRGYVFSVSEMMSIAEGLVWACGDLHRHARFHLDVRPENVWIDQKNRFARFTCMLIYSPLFDVLDTDIFSALAAQSIADGYLAPEMLDQQITVDHRADQYEIGLILHEMLCGSRPNSTPALFPWIEGVSREISDAIRWASSADPEHRYPELANFYYSLQSSPGQAIIGGSLMDRLGLVLFLCFLVYQMVSKVKLEEQLQDSQSALLSAKLAAMEFRIALDRHQQRFVMTDIGVCDNQAEIHWALADNRRSVDCPDAMRYCQSLGPGWRLPTEVEISQMSGSDRYFERDVWLSPGYRRS